MTDNDEGAGRTGQAGPPPLDPAKVEWFVGSSRKRTCGTWPRTVRRRRVARRRWQSRRTRRSSAISSTIAPLRASAARPIQTAPNRAEASVPAHVPVLLSRSLGSRGRRCACPRRCRSGRRAPSATSFLPRRCGRSSATGHAADVDVECRNSQPRPERAQALRKRSRRYHARARIGWKSSRVARWSASILSGTQAAQSGEARMPVVGVGYFFRSKDPAALKASYRDHLGVARRNGHRRRWRIE